jgi:heme/copper-type cytochrome/quinol oxidase subunit 4
MVATSKLWMPHTTVTKVFVSSFWPEQTIRYMFLFLHAMTKNNDKTVMMMMIIIIIIIIIITNYSILWKYFPFLKRLCVLKRK